MTLLAVSKTKPIEDIQALYDLGHRDFAENYVNELLEKQQQLPEDINWHFIGRLQSNKVNKVITPQLASLHSIDKVKLAKKVNQNIQGKNEISDPLKVFLQVNITNEDTKTGVTQKDQLWELFEFVDQNCPNLDFRGLMCLAYDVDGNTFRVRQKVKLFRK
jgi:pyridoxal phosphate enzyme (YggS family)